MKTKFRFLILIITGIVFLKYLFFQISNTTVNKIYLTKIDKNENFRFETVPIYNQNKDIVLIQILKNYVVSNKDSKIKQFSFPDLFKLLESNKVVLIDTTILKTRKLVTAFNMSLISFGVLPENIKQINKLDKELTSFVQISKCFYFKREGYFQKFKILTNVYVKCGGYAIQISIMYERGSFLWIGSDDNNAYNYIKNRQFGDISRAVNQFEIKKDTIDTIPFYVPTNVEKFLFDYKHSAFVECNEELAKKNQNLKYIQNKRKNKQIQTELKYISDSLEALQKEYWLAAGTLLGIN